MNANCEQRVSIAMATYNGQPYVRKQIDSILNQIRTDDQFVIVDDTSNDGTWEYLVSLKHPAIELFRHEVNQGVRLTFQDALQHCRHEIIFLSDQDDVWLPNKRDTVVRAFAGLPDATVIVSDARIIDDLGHEVGRSFMQQRGGFRGGVLSTLLKNRYLGCAMAIRRRVLRLALPIPQIAPMHDMWLGAMASLQGKAIYLAQPLIEYRRHDGNVSPSAHRSVAQMTRWRIVFAFAILERLHGRKANIEASRENTK